MTQGTREWSKQNVNFQSGCMAGCEYCYAREMAERYNRHDWNDWSKKITIDIDKVNKNYKYHEGVTMFPSSHNIDITNFHVAMIPLRKLLEAGNKVLIVMKPSYQVVDYLCDQLWIHTKRVEFRFTITSYDQNIAMEFEPNAPSINSRLASIKKVIDSGYKLSISIEPFLDKEPQELINEIVTNYGVDHKDIWLGPMNHVNRLANFSKIIDEQLLYLREIYHPDRLRDIYNELKGTGINFKDSFLKQAGVKNNDY